MSLCAICCLDLSTKPRGQTWEKLIASYPKLKAYFDQSPDKVNVPMEVEALTTSCKNSFHNICITDWFLKTKSPTCPCCAVTLNFNDMREKHLHPITEDRDALYGLSKLQHNHGDENLTHHSGPPKVQGDNGESRHIVQPRVMVTEMTHHGQSNILTTKCTTFLYEGRSRMLDDLEKDPRPRANSKEEWDASPPWESRSVTPEENGVKEGPIVFPLPPPRIPASSSSSRSSSCRDSDSILTTSSDSDLYHSVRSDSLEGAIAMRAAAALRRRRYAFSSASGQGPRSHRFGIVFPNGEFGYYRF